MPVTKEGSVRVDLVGGALGIGPIHFILKNVLTINVATSLKAKVSLTKQDTNTVEIISHDYNTESIFKEEEFTKENVLYNDHFGPLKFVCQILDYHQLRKGLKVELSSGAPAGSGLGGSSAMGVTLMSALNELTDVKEKPVKTIEKVRKIESRILNQGIAGYQDYYPALFGGVLGLIPSIDEIKVDQLYSPELKDALESTITLVFSGKSRLSGINNWEVYKSFFDGDKAVRKGMQSIADVSYETYQAILKENFDELPGLIAKEGEERKKLFPGILSPEMKELYKKVTQSLPKTGLKACGAGGGGCFILTHESSQKDDIINLVQESGMTILDFKIEKPLS